MGSLDAIGNYDAIKKEIVMGGCMNIYVLEYLPLFLLVQVIYNI